MLIRPPIDPTLTIRPRACLNIGRNACANAIGPTRFTSSCLRRSSSGRNSSGPGNVAPALLTSPRSPSSRTVAPTAAAAAAIDSPSVTSISSGVTCNVDARSSSQSACLRTPANTLNPIPASLIAVARPIPVDVPVTTTAPRPDGRPSGRFLAFFTWPMHVLLEWPLV